MMKKAIMAKTEKRILPVMRFNYSKTESPANCRKFLHHIIETEEGGMITCFRQHF